MKKNLLSIILFLSFFPAISFSQITSVGTEFWFGFPDGIDFPEYEIKITSEVGATGTLDIAWLGISQSFTVPPSGSISLNYPSFNNLEVSVNQTIQNKAIHITTDQPVAVYAVATQYATTDGTIVLPVNALGLDYMITSFEPLPFFGFTYTSEFLIVATDNNTPVEIIPSQTTLNGNPPGVPFTITLNQGDCYLVKSNSDLTGSRVKVTDNQLCKRIAVFEGNECANVPNNTTYACDQLLEQSIPTPIWGTKFITAPLRNRLNYSIKVLALDNNTTYQIDGATQPVLNSGQFALYTFGTVAKYISSDKPIMVTQYATGTTYDNQLGDPFAMYIAPIEQQSSRIVFEGTVTLNIGAPYLNIVCPTVHTNDMLLDGNQVPLVSFFTVPNNPTYSYARLAITPGNHVLESINGFFTAYIYGFGTDDSYGMITGGSFNPVASIPQVIVYGDTMPTVFFTDTLECYDSLGLYLPPDSTISGVQWALNGGTPVAGNPVYTTSFQNGLNTVQLTYITTGDICRPADTITFNFTFFANKSTVQDLVPDTLVCNVSSVVINVTQPPGTITWEDNTTNNPRTITAPGSYSLVLVTPDGCEIMDTFQVDITNLSFDLGNDSMLCPPDPITLTSPVQGDSYLWSTGATTASINATDPGFYKLTVTDGVCVFSDSLQILPFPSISFTLPPDTFICAGDSLTLSGPSGFSGYLWSTQSFDQSILVINAGTYWLQISECSQTYTDTIKVEYFDKDDFLIPNVFSPNNDGINDEWKIAFVSPENLDSYRLTIFNRWGQTVWESFNATEGWNGNINNQPAKEGTYYFILEVASPCFNKKIENGTLMLVGR